MTRDEAIVLERKVAQALGLDVTWDMMRECFTTLSRSGNFARLEEFRPLQSNHTCVKTMHQLKVTIDWSDCTVSTLAVVGGENKVLVYQMAGSSIEDLRFAVASLAAYYAEQMGLVV